MEVTIWQDDRVGVHKKDRDNKEYFNESWKDIRLQLDDEVCPIPLNATFWTTCPHFQSGKLSEWLRNKGFVQGTRLELSPLRENLFDLKGGF